MSLVQTVCSFWKYGIQADPQVESEAVSLHLLFFWEQSTEPKWMSAKNLKLGSYFWALGSCRLLYASMIPGIGTLVRLAGEEKGHKTALETTTAIYAAWLH